MKNDNKSLAIARKEFCMVLVIIAKEITANRKLNYMVMRQFVVFQGHSSSFHD